MLSLRIARMRASPAIWKQAQRYTSTKSSFWTTSVKKVIGYTGTAGVLTTAGVWWSTTTRDKVSDHEDPPAEHLAAESEPFDGVITRMLTQEAYTILPRSVAGITRYDGAQLPSNSPCEDRFTHCQFPSPWDGGNSWIAWAVFDGHSGCQTADLLVKQLLPAVQDSLSHAKLPSNKEPVPEELVQRAIIKAFMDVDDSIVNSAMDISGSRRPLQEKMQKLAPAFAGSCALLSIYDPATSRLHVACTGDSRAVLAQQSSDGNWEAVAISVDQNGNNKEEVARLKQEHPGEDDIVKDGRILGLVVSRAFGDARWKWPAEVQKDFVRRFYAPGLASGFDIKTPPYITAEPVVTTTTIDSGKPSFLILATDGLWDTLSNKQAVDLVGTWLQSRATVPKKSKPKPMHESFDFGHFWKGVNWKFVEDRTIIQDDNVAVHLMRNSLGGNHQELIAGRLAVSFPLSRRLRDDITVQVVFFNIPDLQIT